MTLDEAIEYHINVATRRAVADEGIGGNAKWEETNSMTKEESEQIIAHNRQLAEWLTQLKEIKEKIESGDLSDGYHTFNQLYHQRAMLFATIVKQNKDKAWKTHKHEDGKLCFGGGWFLVTIDTPEGAYGYHYEDKYWDLFDCQELDVAKHWDGYTEADVSRFLSLGASR